jgi:hypothetical protein
MSNSASLSAAKRRRGGGPPLGQTPGASGPQGPQGPQISGNLPQGLPLPPNFRQMPPQIQQQILRQMQQRMMQQQQQPQQQQQQQQQQQPQQQPQQQHPSIGATMSANNMNEKMPPRVSGNGPYVVNSVLHNRAVSEIDGYHIRDLPMSSAGLPCLPSGAALPPNILFKLHHDELLNQDALINEYSNRLQMFTNRVDKIERMITHNNGNDQISTLTTTSSVLDTQNDMNGIVNNSEFIAKILDNILTNTNLSDIINQIEPLQKENETLRGLIHSQQKTLNELSVLVMNIINGKLPHQEYLTPQSQQNYDSETNRMPTTTITTDNFNIKYDDIKDEFCNYGNRGENGENGETGEVINNVEQLYYHGEEQNYAHKNNEVKDQGNEDDEENEDNEDDEENEDSEDDEENEENEENKENKENEHDKNECVS